MKKYVIPKSYASLNHRLLNKFIMEGIESILWVGLQIQS